MDMKPKLQHTLLAICVTQLLLLTACGGGGGSGGMVRSDPPRTPPPPVASGPCPAPVTNDCVVTTSASMTGNRTSDHSLIIRDGLLDMRASTYRFAGGTVIESALNLQRNSVLESNVRIAPEAYFWVGGIVRGAVVNQGQLDLYGEIFGRVENEGVLYVDSGSVSSTGRTFPNRITGDFRQEPEGTLSISLPTTSAILDYRYTLQVTGSAQLDGTLLLREPSDGWDRYPFPATPTTAHILHADGGVLGQFSHWTSPGLFVEGSVRYGSNDVWFDLTRISLQAAMAANAAADPLTLASAANLDTALSRADGFALPSASLNDSQRRFLASAASMLYARDVARATRIIDSLSGHAHLLAQDLPHEQAATSAAQLDARLQDLPHGVQGGAWSSALRNEGGLGGTYSMDGQASGYDQWLTPQWLVGSSVSRNQGRMQFERMGGQGQGESPMASVYAHYRRGDWHATGLVGAGRTTLQLDRPIDLGAAGEHVAHSRREIGQAFVHGELGRRVMLGNDQLTPFVSVDYSALHSDGFSEQGDTGFELVAQSARSTQLSAAVGARYAHDWRFAGKGWLRLNLDARYQRRLADGGDAQQAAFIGVPDAVFDLTAWSQADGFAAMNLGLAGGFGDRWTWSADHARRFGIDAGKGGWFVGLRRDF